MTNEMINLANRSGSVSFEEIVPLLQQQALLYEYLTSTLNIEEVGSGTRLGRQWVHLGGARIAPYEFTATPKNTKTGSLLLVINANTIFYDDAGNSLELDDPTIFDSAIRFEETLLSVSVSAELP